MVHYKLDLSHFRSAAGTSKAVRTVKIIGWAGEEPRADFGQPEVTDDDGGSEREERRGRDRDDRKGRSSTTISVNEMTEKAEIATTSVDEMTEKTEMKARPRIRRRNYRGFGICKAWLTKLMEFMEIDGEVIATGSDERVHLRVNATERAGRRLGGAALRLRVFVKSFPSLSKSMVTLLSMWTLRTTEPVKKAVVRSAARSRS